MENPLDLKLLMNQSSISTSIGPTIITNTTKAYKCETCNATYTDKMYFDLHKQSHHKEIAQVVSPKDIPMVQILQIQGHHQIHPQPTPAHQQQHSGHQIIIQEDQVAAYKRAYGVETQQVYTLAPVTQYQVISTGGNNRGGTVSINTSQHNQVSIPNYSTPTYILATTPDGGHQLQPINEIIQHEIIHDHQEQHEQQIHHMQHEPQIITADIQQPQHIQIASQSNSNRSTNRNVFIVKDRPFKCDQCTASFIDIEELDDHRKKHTGDGPFTCEDCHFTFMYKSHFRSHKTRCQKKRAMNPQTPKTIIVNTSPVKRQFPTFQQQNIKQESFIQHSTSSPIIQTTKYVTVSSRNNNLRQGNKQMPPNKFNPSNPTFKRVKKESKLDRPYECDECDASFQSDMDLKSHKSKHTGEGPFKCEECKFVFLYRKLYEAHRRRCEKKRRESDHSDISDSLHGPTVIIPPMHNLSSVSSNSNMNSDSLPHITHVQHIQQPQDVQMHSPSISLSVPTSLSSVLSGPIHMHSVGGQPTIIEMRQGHEIQQILPHQAIIEQVIVGPGQSVSGISGGRHEIKYEMVSAGDMIEGVNVNQIMNLIKVKEVNH